MRSANRPGVSQPVRCISCFGHDHSFFGIAFTTPGPPSSASGPDLSTAQLRPATTSTSSRVPLHDQRSFRFLMMGGGQGAATTSRTWSMIFLSSQLAGNSVLPGLPTSVPMPAATARLAVEYVGGPFRGDVDVLGLRPVLRHQPNPTPNVPHRPPHRHHQPPYRPRRPGAPRSTPRGYATRAAPAASREHHHPALAARAGRSRRSRRQADLMPSARPHITYSNHRNALILRPVTNQATSSPRPFPGP